MSATMGPILSCAPRGSSVVPLWPINSPRSPWFAACSSNVRTKKNAMPCHGSSCRGGLFGHRDHRVELLVVDGVEELFACREALVHGADADVCLARDLVVADVKAALADPSSRGREDALPVALGIAAQRWPAAGFALVGHAAERIREDLPDDPWRAVSQPHIAASRWWTNCTTAEPSAIAAAQRLNEPARTSPAA